MTVLLSIRHFFSHWHFFPICSVTFNQPSIDSILKYANGKVIQTETIEGFFATLILAT